MLISSGLSFTTVTSPYREQKKKKKTINNFADIKLVSLKGCDKIFRDR